MGMGRGEGVEQVGQGGYPRPGASGRTVGHDPSCVGGIRGEVIQGRVGPALVVPGDVGLQAGLELGPVLYWMEEDVVRNESSGEEDTM